MFRPIFHIIGVVVLVLAVLALWRPVGSYARAAAHSVHQAANEAVPVAFEIDRLQCLIDDLDGVIDQQRGRVIAQSVDRDRLAKQSESARLHAKGLEAEVRAARQLLSEDQPVYRIDGREHSRERVRSEAKATAVALERSREIAAAKAEALAALSDALEQAEDKIDEAERQRQQYQLKLSQLRAQAETVAIKAELTRSLEHLPARIDDGSFREVEQAFARVERKLAVEQRALERADAPAGGDIRFSAPPQEDILARLDAALDAGSTTEGPASTED